jgi:hypothetical protein
MVHARTSAAAAVVGPWARRRITAAVVAGIAAGLLVGAAPATVDAQDDADVDDQSVSAEQALVERFAPVIVVREQDGPCDTNGEPFEPAPVEIVLDNPEISLRVVGNGDPVRTFGPGAADLFDLREGWYLDFPGDALEPGCIFEEDFHRFWDGQSVVYAHVATQADRPGFVAVQYWTFWYHNPAKNDHEGDWEFVQLLFEADTAAEALRGEPVAVGYAQHTGGERSDWDDPKLELEGDHPVVYAARGSHASYFGSALYLGRSSREGFGCDNTTGPSRRLDPDVVLLPDQVTDRDDPLAWLAFQGRWGQREAGFFNGPTGPYEKERWTEPVDWHEGLRSSSVVIPSGDRFGDGAIRVFCESVEVGSSALTSTLRSPIAAIVALALVALLVILVVRGTTWTPVTTRPLRDRRAIGQILRGSWRVWLAHPRAMLAIGLIYIPVTIATSAIQYGILAIPLVDDVIDLAGERSSVAFVVSMFVGGIADLLTFVFVVAAVSRVVADDRDPGGWALPSGAEVITLLRAVARATVIVGALLLSVVGIPWGIRQLVRYQFVPQAIVIERRDARASLDRSSDLVRGRWWWTAGAVLGIEVVVTVAGFGAAIAFLLVMRSVPLWAFNLVSGIIYVFLVPIAAGAVTLAYGTLAARRSDDGRVDAHSAADTADDAITDAP